MPAAQYLRQCAHAAEEVAKIREALLSDFGAVFIDDEAILPTDVDYEELERKVLSAMVLTGEVSVLRNRQMDLYAAGAMAQEDETGDGEPNNRAGRRAREARYRRYRK